MFLSTNWPLLGKAVEPNYVLTEFWTTLHGFNLNKKISSCILKSLLPSYIVLVWLGLYVMFPTLRYT